MRSSGGGKEARAAGAAGGGNRPERPERNVGFFGQCACRRRRCCAGRAASAHRPPRAARARSWPTIPPGRAMRGGTDGWLSLCCSRSARLRRGGREQAVCLHAASKRWRQWIAMCRRAERDPTACRRGPARGCPTAWWWRRRRPVEAIPCGGGRPGARHTQSPRTSHCAPPRRAPFRHLDALE